MAHLASTFSPRQVQQITAGEAAGLEPLNVFSSQLGVVYCSLGWSGAALLLLAQRPWSLTSSCSVRLKAAQRLLLQLLRAKERKSFLPGPKTKSAQQNARRAEPWKTWVGSFYKCSHKSKTLHPPEVPHKPGLGLQGLKDTILIFGHRAEDHGIHYHNKSLKDNFCHSETA